MVVKRECPRSLASTLGSLHPVEKGVWQDGGHTIPQSTLCRADFLYTTNVRRLLRRGCEPAGIDSPLLDFKFVARKTL
jgi:hypothetical protein